MTVKHEVDIQNAASDIDVPKDDVICGWCECALLPIDNPVELCVRIVDEAEMADLNHRFHNKNNATNILSFPVDETFDFDSPTQPLGDIVLCASLINAEAEDLNMPAEEHWAHLVIHGILHLLGYDHIEGNEAEEMERTEVELMAKLGYPNPYGDDEEHE